MADAFHRHFWLLLEKRKPVISCHARVHLTRWFDYTTISIKRLTDALCCMSDTWQLLVKHPLKHLSSDTKHLSSKYQAAMKHVYLLDRCLIVAWYLLDRCLVVAWQMLHRCLLDRCLLHAWQMLYATWQMLRAAWQMLDGLLDNQLSSTWHAAQSICQALNGKKFMNDYQSLVWQGDMGYFWINYKIQLDPTCHCLEASWYMYCTWNAAQKHCVFVSNQAMFAVRCLLPSTGLLVSLDFVSLFLSLFLGFFQYPNKFLFRVSFYLSSLVYGHKHWPPWINLLANFSCTWLYFYLLLVKSCTDNRHRCTSACCALGPHTFPLP